MWNEAKGPLLIFIMTYLWLQALDGFTCKHTYENSPGGSHISRWYHGYLRHRINLHKSEQTLLYDDLEIGKKPVFLLIHSLCPLSLPPSSSFLGLFFSICNLYVSVSCFQLTNYIPVLSSMLWQAQAVCFLLLVEHFLCGYWSLI